MWKYEAFYITWYEYFQDILLVPERIFYRGTHNISKVNHMQVFMMRTDDCNDPYWSPCQIPDTTFISNTLLFSTWISEWSFIEVTRIHSEENQTNQSRNQNTMLVCHENLVCSQSGLKAVFAVGNLLSHFWTVLMIFCLHFRGVGG